MKTTLSKHVSPTNETQELLKIIDNHQLDLLRPFAKYNIIEEKLRNNVKSF
jgi:hypothetical protein